MIAPRFERGTVLVMARALILVVALVGSGLAFLLTVPSASGIVACPTMQFSVSFEPGSVSLTEEAQEVFAAAAARSRQCATEVTMVVHAYASDEGLANARARVAYDALAAQYSGNHTIRESYLSGCGRAAEDRTVVTVYLWLPSMPDPQIEVSCHDG